MDILTYFKNMKKEARGQSLVELAISLTVILMLLLGAIEISLALFQFVTIRDAAQEGALYGSINPNDNAGIKLRALAAADDIMPDLTDANITITKPSPACEGVADNGTLNAITVQIQYAHNIAFPLVGPMIGSNTIPLTASVTNTILQPSCDAP